MDKSVKDSNPDVKIGIKMRVFNWHLHEAITRCGWTRAEAAARMGITPNTLYRYLSFKAYPSQERRLKISVVLGVGDEELFPARLEGFRMSSHPIEFAVTESNAALLMGVDDTEYRPTAWRFCVRRYLRPSEACLTQCGTLSTGASG